MEMERNTEEREILGGREREDLMVDSILK